MNIKKNDLQKSRARLRGLLGVAVYAAGFSAVAVNASVDQELESKWYDKSFHEILNSKVVTATRNEKTLKDVPGVVTVFTSHQIRQMGLRSLKEVLDRTTGFFVARQLNGATVGSRGYLADTDQFLLLIDGHNVNSIIDKGMGDQFLFPNLEHVDRIEIIRGPGSTLWGSDASLGIIHVITKKGSDIDGVKLSYNRSNEDNQRHFNIQAGGEVVEGADIMASFTMAESDGFELVNALNGEAIDSVIGNWDGIKDSYEFYAKAEVGEFTLKARGYDAKISRPYISFDSNLQPLPFNEANFYNRRNHFYVDLTHQKQLAQSSSLETRVFMSNLDRTQELVSPKYDSSATVAQESEASQENALGFEMINRWNISSQHFLMLGFRYVETELSPWTFEQIYPVVATSSSTTGEVYQYVVPEENDRSQALFTDYEWKVIPNTLTLLVGARLDDNNLREDKTIFLPRFAVNWNITSDWEAKYSYNTGYIRPGVGIGFLGQAQYNAKLGKPVIGANKSQEIQSHDLQFSYTANQFRSNLNFYYNMLENPAQIIYDDAAVVNSEQSIVFYTNIDQTDTYGLELELQYLINDSLDTYFSLSKVLKAQTQSMTGNSDEYSYNLNEFDQGLFGPVRSFGQNTYTYEGNMQGFPNLMLHAGVNWGILRKLESNLHFRYWDEILVRKPDYTKELELESQLFVDFNIAYLNIANTNIDLSFYVKNLLDNDDSQNYLFLYGNLWQDQGRRVGASVSYSF